MENIKTISSALVSLTAAALSFIEAYTKIGQAVAVTVSILAGIYTIYSNYKRNNK